MIPPMGDLVAVVVLLAFAAYLGVASGVLGVHLFTARKGKLLLRDQVLIVAFAAVVCWLMAARPEIWWVTASFWAMAAVLMALVDLAVLCLIDPWRSTARFTRLTRRSMMVRLMIALPVIWCAVLAILKLGFDIPLNPELIPSFAAKLLLAMLALGAFDLIVRLPALMLIRRRRRRPPGPLPVS